MKAIVIGAGTMGAGIAQVFAQGGYDTLLYDVNDGLAANGKNNIAKGLSKSVDKGKMAQGEADAILSRIVCTSELSLASDCGIAVEAAVENIGVKKDLFTALDAICSADAILATNTSSLSITEIAAATKRPQRIIGMHFFNPAPVMKLVEVINGAYTAPEITDRVFEIAKALGKDPVRVAEAPGFLVNRMLIPMINEAICLLSEGVASAEDIDKAMMLGANHPIGPLALSDLIGNDITLAIMQTLLAETGDPKYRPAPLLRKMVRAGKLGRKTKKGFFNY